MWLLSQLDSRLIIWVSWSVNFIKRLDLWKQKFVEHGNDDGRKSQKIKHYVTRLYYPSLPTVVVFIVPCLKTYDSSDVHRINLKRTIFITESSSHLLGNSRLLQSHLNEFSVMRFYQVPKMLEPSVMRKRLPRLRLPNT